MFLGVACVAESCQMSLVHLLPHTPFFNAAQIVIKGVINHIGCKSGTTCTNNIRLMYDLSLHFHTGKQRLLLVNLF